MPEPADGLWRCQLLVCCQLPRRLRQEALVTTRLRVRRLVHMLRLPCRSSCKLALTAHSYGIVCIQWHSGIQAGRLAAIRSLRGKLQTAKVMELLDPTTVGKWHLANKCASQRAFCTAKFVTPVVVMLASRALQHQRALSTHSKSRC